MKKCLPLLCLWATTIAVASASSSLLTNPGFETGDASGWTASSGKYSVVGNIAHSGIYVAQVRDYSDVAQTVAGLSPNTTYTLVGWFCVSNNGDHIYMAAKKYGGSDLSVFAATTNYSKLSLTFTTGSTNTSADVHVIVWNSGTIGYGDDLNLSVPNGSNLITNPGFETGDASGWTGPCTVIDNVHSGAYAAQVQSNGFIAQIVTGLLPNTGYTCAGWLAVATAGQDLYLIATNFGGTAVSQSVSAATFSQTSLTFMTGPTNTSAEIGVYQGGAAPGYCDDLTLVALPPPAPGSSLDSDLGDPFGVQATRIADCLQRFGVNTFSLLNNNGYPWAWGGSAGNYDYPTTGRAINYITAGSGLTINVREYHRDVGNLTSLQMAWIKGLYGMTGSPFSISLAAYSSTNDVPGIIALVQDSVSSGLNYVKWVEGVNEPNNFGPVSLDMTLAAQTSLFQQVRAITTNVIVMGPSIVFGLPYPDGYITSYIGTNVGPGTAQQTILDNSDVDNLHVYPPYSPNAGDTSSRGGTFADIDTAFKVVLPGKTNNNTEWHPTLYATNHKTNDTYDAYWGPIYLLSSSQDLNWQACFWFSLFDYSPQSTNWMPSGLFKTGDTDPKPVANVFRTLFELTGDLGTNKLTFTPGKIDVAISGLPAAPPGSPRAGGRSALFENSAQQYFLLIWNEQNDISAATTPVTVTFNLHTMTKVEEFNITSGSDTAVQTLTNVHTMTVNLDTSVRLLRITYDARGRFQGVAANGNSSALSFAGMPGYSYNLQRSSNLVNWVTIETTNAPASGSVTFTDTFPDRGGIFPACAYYRLGLNP